MCVDEELSPPTHPSPLQRSLELTSDRVTALEEEETTVAATATAAAAMHAPEPLPTHPLRSLAVAASVGGRGRSPVYPGSLSGPPLLQGSGRPASSSHSARPASSASSSAAAATASPVLSESVVAEGEAASATCQCENRPPPPPGRCTACAGGGRVGGAAAAVASEPPAYLVQAQLALRRAAAASASAATTRGSKSPTVASGGADPVVSAAAVAAATAAASAIARGEAPASIAVQHQRSQREGGTVVSWGGRGRTMGDLPVADQHFRRHSAHSRGIRTQGES